MVGPSHWRISRNLEDNPRKYMQRTRWQETYQTGRSTNPPLLRLRKICAAWTDTLVCWNTVQSILTPRNVMKPTIPRSGKNSWRAPHKEGYTVVPRQVGHSVIRSPRHSGLEFSGTQPRESNGKKSKKRIKNEVPRVLQRKRTYFPIAHRAHRGLRTTYRTF